MDRLEILAPIRQQMPVSVGGGPLHSPVRSCQEGTARARPVVLAGELQSVLGWLTVGIPCGTKFWPAHLSLVSSSSLRLTAGGHLPVAIIGPLVMPIKRCPLQVCPYQLWPNHEWLFILPFVCRGWMPRLTGRSRTESNQSLYE